MSDKKEPRYIRGHYSVGQKEATARYNAKAYDDIRLRLKKGQKADLQKIAAQHNMSLNGFITEAIFCYVEKLETSQKTEE